MATENYLRTGIVNKPKDLSYLSELGLIFGCTFIPEGNLIIDISGSGVNGTISGSVSTTTLGILFDSIEDPALPGLYTPKDGCVEFGNVGTIQSVSMNIKWRHAGNTTLSAIFQANADSYGYFDLNMPFLSGPVSGTVFLNGFQGVSLLPESGWNSMTIVFDEPVSADNFVLSRFNNGIDTFGNYEIRDLRVWDRALSEFEIQEYADSFGEIILYADFSAEADGTPVPKDFIVAGGEFAVTTQHGNQNRPYLSNKDKYVECISGPGYIGAPLNDEYGEFEVVIYKQGEGDVFDWHVMSENIGPLDLDLYREPGAPYGERNGINIRWDADGKFKFYYIVNEASTYPPGAMFGNSEEYFAPGQWLSLKLVVGKTGRYMLYVNDRLIDNLVVGYPQIPSYTSFILPSGAALTKIKFKNIDYTTTSTLVDILRDFGVSGTTEVTATLLITSHGFLGDTWLSWELYRSPDGISDWSRIATVYYPTQTYVDTTTGGEAFYYKARLVAGNMYTGFSKVRPAGGSALAEPYSFNGFGNGDEGRILWNWNNSGVTNADGIDIQLSTDNVTFNTIATVPSGTTSYQGLHLGSTKQYYSRLRVRRGVQEALSNVYIVVTLQAIRQPVCGANQIAPTEVEIFWSASGPWGEGEGNEAWRVFRSPDDITYTEIFTTTDLNLANYIDTNPLASQWYKVAADDGRVYAYSDPVQIILV